MYENSVCCSLMDIKMKMKGHGDTVKQIPYSVYSRHRFLNLLSRPFLCTYLCEWHMISASTFWLILETFCWGGGGGVGTGGVEPSLPRPPHPMSHVPAWRLCPRRREAIGCFGTVLTKHRVAPGSPSDNIIVDVQYWTLLVPSNAGIVFPEISFRSSFL